MGQAPAGEGFELDLHLVGDGHFHRMYEGVADQADVAACRGPVRRRRLAVQETPAIGAGDGPEVAPIRPAYLRIRLVHEAHRRHEAHGAGAVHERLGQPQPSLPGQGCQDQRGQREARVPGDEAQEPSHGRSAHSRRSALCRTVTKGIRPRIGGVRPAPKNGLISSRPAEQHPARTGGQSVWPPPSLPGSTASHPASSQPWNTTARPTCRTEGARRRSPSSAR